LGRPVAGLPTSSNHSFKPWRQYVADGKLLKEKLHLRNFAISLAWEGSQLQLRFWIILAKASLPITRRRSTASPELLTWRVDGKGLCISRGAMAPTAAPLVEGL